MTSPIGSDSIILPTPTPTIQNNVSVQLPQSMLVASTDQPETYGSCAVDDECLPGYFCDFSETTFRNNDPRPIGVCRRNPDTTGTGSGSGTSGGTTNTTVPSLPQPTPVPIPPIRGDFAKAVCGSSILADKRKAKTDENNLAIQRNNLYREFYQNWALGFLGRPREKKYDILCIDYVRCGGSRADCFQFEDQWRDCKTRRIQRSDIPGSYLEIKFQNGTSCWEEDTPLKFEPDLAEALYFSHQRGEGLQPKKVNVINPSGGRGYVLTFETNSEITFTPNALTILPKETKELTVQLSPSLIEKLGDGLSQIELEIKVREIK